MIGGFIKNKKVKRLTPVLKDFEAGLIQSLSYQTIKSNILLPLTLVANPSFKESETNKAISFMDTKPNIFFNYTASSVSLSNIVNPKNGDAVIICGEQSLRVEFDQNYFSGTGITLSNILLPSAVCFAGSFVHMQPIINPSSTVQVFIFDFATNLMPKTNKPELVGYINFQSTEEAWRQGIFLLVYYIDFTDLYKKDSTLIAPLRNKIDKVNKYAEKAYPFIEKTIAEWTD